MAIPIKAVLSVSTKGFTVGMKGATKVLGGFVGLAKMATTALLALGAGFAAIIFTQSRFIDNLGKTASKLGVGVEFLQKFRFAAEQTGISIETADMGLQRFVRRLGEAQKGTGELLPALKQLGITQKDLAGLSPEQAFLLFADALAEVNGKADKLSVLFKAVDSEAVGLINLIGEGSEAFLEFARTAEGMGFILSQDAVDGVENFSDELNKLMTMIGGVVRQVVAALAPALAVLTIQFQEFIKEISSSEGGFEELAFTIANTLAAAFNSFLTGLEKVLNFMAELGNSIVQLGRAVPGLDLFPLDDDAAARYEEVSEAIKNVEQQARNFRVAGGLGVTPQGGFQGAIDSIKTLGFTEDAKILQDLFNNLSKVDLLSDVLEQTRTTDMSFFRESLINALNLAEAVSPEVLAEFLPFGQVDFSDLRKTISDAVEKGITTGTKDGVEKPETIEAVKSFFEKLAESFAKAAETTVLTLKQKFEAAGIGDFARTLEEGLVKAATAFEDALTQAFLTGKADFGDLADLIKQTLVKAFIQSTITNPIFKLFGLVGKAKGGPVSANTPYIVGEEGPELFMPGASGTIVPNHQLGQSTGGGGTSVNYTINAVDSQSFEQALARDPSFVFAVTEAGRRKLPGRV
jgi:hypothetical protein